MLISGIAPKIPAPKLLHIKPLPTAGEVAADLAKQRIL